MWQTVKKPPRLRHCMQVIVTDLIIQITHQYNRLPLIFVWVSCLHSSRSVSLWVYLLHVLFRLRSSQVSHPPPSPSASLLIAPPLCPTAARLTAHQNDNSIDVKCVAFGPLEHITPACLAQPPLCRFMALLWTPFMPSSSGGLGGEQFGKFPVCLHRSGICA